MIGRKNLFSLLVYNKNLFGMAIIMYNFSIVRDETYYWGIAYEE